VEIDFFCFIFFIFFQTELNYKALLKLKGLKGIEKALRTNYSIGLKSSDLKDLEERKQKYGKNEVRIVVLVYSPLFTLFFTFCCLLTTSLSF
jgi:hypothetical protein